MAPNDVAAVVYTSGTSGPPKGVALTHELIVRFLAAFDTVAGRDPVDEVSFLPIAHATQRVCGHYRAMLSGSCATFCTDPAELVATVAEARPSFLLAPPLIWAKLADTIRARLSSEADATTLLDAAPARARDRRRAAPAFGPSPRPRRATPARRARPPRLCPDRRGPLPARAARVAARARPAGPQRLRHDRAGLPDDQRAAARRRHQRRTAAPGVEISLADDGEVLARTAWGVGRARNRADAAANIKTSGKSPTGDIGTIDEAGRLHIMDRKKDLIISLAGHDMSPTNIEAELEAASPMIERLLRRRRKTPQHRAARTRPRSRQRTRPHNRTGAHRPSQAVPVTCRRPGRTASDGIPGPGGWK